jgi:hypothetical protein
MPDDDSVVADEDVLDDEAHDSLPFKDVKRILRRSAKSVRDCSAKLVQFGDAFLRAIWQVYSLKVTH